MVEFCLLADVDTGLRPSLRGGTGFDCKCESCQLRVPSRESNDKLFSISRFGEEMKLPLNTRCLEKSAGSGERTVPTLKSLS